MFIVSPFENPAPADEARGWVKNASISLRYLCQSAIERSQRYSLTAKTRLIANPRDAIVCYLHIASTDTEIRKFAFARDADVGLTSCWMAVKISDARPYCIVCFDYRCHFLPFRFGPRRRGGAS